MNALESIDYAIRTLAGDQRKLVAAQLGEARDDVSELIEALRSVIRWEDVSQLDHEWPLVVAECRAALARYGVKP